MKYFELSIAAVLQSICCSHVKVVPPGSKVKAIHRVVARKAQVSTCGCLLSVLAFMPLFSLTISCVHAMAREVASGVLCLPSSLDETFVRLATVSHRAPSKAKPRNYKIVY